MTKQLCISTMDVLSELDTRLPIWRRDDFLPVATRGTAAGKINPMGSFSARSDWLPPDVSVSVFGQHCSDWPPCWGLDLNTVPAVCSLLTLEASGGR